MLRHRLHFYLLFMIACLFLSVACSSPSNNPTGNPTALPATSPTALAGHKIGERVQVDSWLITVNVYSSSGDNSYTPKSGNALLICNISQQNQGNQATTARGADDWSLRDSSGTKFPLVTQSGYGTFPSASVAANETATGTLVYEVPTSTQHFLLTFAPPTGGHQTIWNIASSDNPTGSPTTSSTPPASHTIGEKVSVGPWVITVNTYSSSGDNSYTPKAGNTLLICDISQQNQGSKAATVGAGDWSLRDNSGKTFPLVTQSGYGTFPSDKVEAGDTTSGTLVYEVPTSTRDFFLTFAPPTGGYQTIWDVPLK